MTNGWLSPLPSRPVKSDEDLRREREAKIGELERRGLLRSERLRQAMLTVRREDFIPSSYRDHAYQEIPLPLPGERATISCPDASPLLRAGTGSTCVPTATGALCGDATCSAASATCNGSVASSCYTDKGVTLSLDCADYSQSCVTGGCTAAGGGGACAAGGLPRCDGAAIVRCSGGVELRTDCATRAVGSSCYAGNATAPEPYCGFGTACFPTKGAETCSGTSVTFCNAGASATVDCAALGFSTCLSGHCF